jgi:enoyl-CoA hydratase/carnithine racemase
MTTAPPGPEPDAGAVVLREDVGTISVLTLNRPRFNTWGPDMSDALSAHLHDIQSDPGIRGCVLTGAGEKAFSSGVDISKRDAHSGKSGERTLQALGSGTYPVFADLTAFTKPLVCAVNGYAIGAGFVIALCSDVVLASDNASFRMPQVELGLIPAYGALARLALWVGRGRAFEIGVAGKKVSAAEGRDIGLVSAVWPQADLRARAMETAQSLAGLPPLAYAVAKESLTTAFENSLVQPAARADLYRSMALRHTADADEAHKARREQRKPEYRGE